MVGSPRDSSSPLDRLRIPGKRGFGLWIASAILVVGVASPAIGGLEREMQLVTTVFLFVIVLWLTEAVPYVVSSTFAMVLLYALGLVDTFEEAVSGFATELVFFILFLFLLGGAITKVGLGKVVAGRMLSKRSTPRSTVRSLAGHLIALAFLMPSAVARTVTFMPIVEQMTEAYDLDQEGPFRKASVVVLGHVNPIGSMMLMTGGGMAIIASQLINESGRSVTWFEWGVYMVPPTLLLFWLTTLITTYVYDVDDSRTVDVNSLPDSADRDIATADEGPLTREQRMVGIVMFGALVAWILGSFVGMAPIIPAIVAVVALAVPGVDVVDRSLLRDVNWGILFLIGAMFSILDVMDATGTLDLLFEVLLALIPFGSMSTWGVIGTLLAIAVFIRSWFSTASAALVVVLPIVLEFATVLDVNQLYLGLSVLIVIGTTTVFPFNTTTVLLSFDEGPLGLREVFLFGVVTLCSGLAIIVLSWLVYWPIVT